MSERRSGIRPEQRPTRRNALVLYLLSGIGLFAASLLLDAIGGRLQGADAKIVNLGYNLVYYLGFLALPLALSVKRRPEILPALRPNPISLLSVLAIVAMVLLGVTMLQVNRSKKLASVFIIAFGLFMVVFGVIELYGFFRG